MFGVRNIVISEILLYEYCRSQVYTFRYLHINNLRVCMHVFSATLSSYSLLRRDPGSIACDYLANPDPLLRRDPDSIACDYLAIPKY